MLSNEQLAAYETQLRALSDALERQLQDHESSSATVDLDQPIGRLSRMDALQQQSMSQYNRTRTQIRLKKIEAALLSIARGDYGECRICGDDIGTKRLDIAPETPLCIQCQSNRE